MINNQYQDPEDVHLNLSAGVSSWCVGAGESDFQSELASESKSKSESLRNSASANTDYDYENTKMGTNTAIDTSIHTSTVLIQI